jgi:hypothetical protein
MEFINSNAGLFTGVMPVAVDRSAKEEAWSYDASVEKVRVVFAHWKKLTTEMIEELIRARTELSKSGNPLVRTEDGVERRLTWNDYCKEVGINRRTANRWIDRYLSPNELPEQPVREKEIDENVIVNAVRKLKSGNLEVSVMCPHCGQNHTVEVRAA